MEMNAEQRLIEIYAHLHIVVNGGGFHLIRDELDRNHVLDAYIATGHALDELRDAARAALIETIATERDDA